MQSSPASKLTSLYDRLITTPLNFVQHPFLLAIRLYWGYQFYLAGKGKLMNLDRTAEFFASINIPLPKLNAMMASSIECFGGLLLLLGLGSRITSVPLATTMIVAYFTAHREELVDMFNNPDGFLSAPPFLFLLSAMIIMAFGPGIFSLDALIRRFMQQPQIETSPNHTTVEKLA